MFTWLRKIVLAVALAAYVLPAFAQAPAPVPALPDAERRTSYSISASTCGCAVGFALYGDSTDYGNWLEVWLNGALVSSSSYTITSPSGPLAALPRPITDAVLNFTSVQTGTVQIVGARRPRRTSQFSENRGVAARDLNQTITDIVAQNREVWDKTNDVAGRVPRVPPGETQSQWPPAASRAGLSAIFDSGGNLVPGAALSGTTITAGNGIALTGVNPASVAANLLAGSGIAITGTNPLTISATAGASSLYVRPQDYGAACNGVTNDAVALQNMLTANAGKTIFIPAGTCLSNSTLTMPSNTTIIGAGREVSILKCTANPCLSGTNVSNISLDSFQILGTDSATSWTTSVFGPVSITQNASSVANGSDYKIRNMNFAGFNANYWVYFSAVGSTNLLRNITFDNNYFVTGTADIPTDPTASNNNNYGLVIFSGSAGSGRVENTIVRNNRFEATALCFPVVLYSNHYKAQIHGNMVLNPGNTSTGHCVNSPGTANNAYGILVYDFNADGNPPYNISIENNTIIQPVSAGIYMVGDGNVAHTTAIYNSSHSIIAGNLIEQQSGTDDNVLPRGCAVVSLLTDVAMIGNSCWQSFGGYAAVGQQTGVVQIEANGCFNGTYASAQTAYCVKLGSGGNGSSNTDRRIVRGNYLEQIDVSANGGNAIKAISATGARFNDVEISDNAINSGWVGVQFAAQFATGSVVIKGNKFGGVMNNYMLSVNSNTGQPISVMNNVFDSSGGVNGNGMLGTSSTVHMFGNKFINRASGSVTMLNLTGACGTLIGTQFNNVVQAAQITAGGLGTSNPSGCTLNYLDQVQNLTPTETGAASSKYVVDHWLHASTTASTTHVEQRQLTGN